MWKLYLQYYLWRALPRWFKQPAVLQMRQKTIREAKVVSISYHLDFEKYKTAEHFIEHLLNSGYNLHISTYQQQEDLIENRIYLSQTIVSDKSLDAATLMPYFDANPWSDLKIRVGEKVIADAIVINQAVLVPWQPGVKG